MRDCPLEWIYKIEHTKTGRVYIGRTKNAERRFHQHITALRNHRHKNKEMQFDFDTHGDFFTWAVIDEVKDVTERNKEAKYIFLYNSANKSCGYNSKDPAITRRKEVTQRKWCNLYNQLTEAQRTYLYTFATKLFGIVGDEECKHT